MGFQYWFDASVSKTDFVSLESPWTARFGGDCKRSLSAPLQFAPRSIQKHLAGQFILKKTLACLVEDYLSQAGCILFSAAANCQFPL